MPWGDTGGSSGQGVTDCVTLLPWMASLEKREGTQSTKRDGEWEVCARSEQLPQGCQEQTLPLPKGVRGRLPFKNRADTWVAFIVSGKK